MAIVAAVVAGSATGGNAAEGPDYIGFQSKAARFAFVVASGTTCRHFGRDVSLEAVLQKQQDIIDEAVRSGISADSALLIIETAHASESAREQRRSDQVRNSADVEVAGGVFMDYWEKRCASLAADPVYGSLFPLSVAAKPTSSPAP